LEQQGDPVEFLGWLLNRLHKDMGGTKKKKSSARPSNYCWLIGLTCRI
jgi:ubiquitin C-terminal hydrolase